MSSEYYSISHKSDEDQDFFNSRHRQLDPTRVVGLSASTKIFYLLRESIRECFSAFIHHLLSTVLSGSDRISSKGRFSCFRSLVLIFLSQIAIFPARSLCSGSSLPSFFLKLITHMALCRCLNAIYLLSNLVHIGGSECSCTRPSSRRPKSNSYVLAS
jgi:hypothetical protein